MIPWLILALLLQGGNGKLTWGHESARPSYYRLSGQLVADPLDARRVEVRLKDEAGNIIQRVQAFSNGAFYFDDVPMSFDSLPENYWVEVVDSRFKYTHYHLIFHNPADTGKEVIVPLEPSEGPTSAKVLSALGQVLVDSGDFRESMDELLQISNPNAADHYDLGVDYFNLGDSVAAQQQLEMAISMDPAGNPAAYLRLHDAYIKNGSPTAALAALENYLRLFPKDANRKTVEETARKLQAAIRKSSEQP